MADAEHWRGWDRALKNGTLGAKRILQRESNVPDNNQPEFEHRQS
jgi:hypothetical protein